MGAGCGKSREPPAIEMAWVAAGPVSGGRRSFRSSESARSPVTGLFRQAQLLRRGVVAARLVVHRLLSGSAKPGDQRLARAHGSSVSPSPNQSVASGPCSLPDRMATVDQGPIDSTDSSPRQGMAVSRAQLLPPGIRISGDCDTLLDCAAEARAPKRRPTTQEARADGVVGF